MSMNVVSVILAAGKGTRMRSSMPKVLHPILGKPMASYAVQAARQAVGTTPVLVIGYEADRVRQTLGEEADYVVQDPQLGTGHAVQQAQDLLQGKAGFVLVTTADMPLLTRKLCAVWLRHSKSMMGRSRC